MNNADIWTGFMAGGLSFLTPESLLLFPLLLGAIGAGGRIAVLALAAGLGATLVAGGAIAVWLAVTFALDASWLRWIACGLLVVQGLLLFGITGAFRMAFLTGSDGEYQPDEEPNPSGNVVRLFLLSFVAGAYWLPHAGPILVKASLMAAEPKYNSAGLAILFAYGFGAALPWIVPGYLMGILMQSKLGGVADTRMGKCVLGYALLVVAGLCLSGGDAFMFKWLNKAWPAPLLALALRY